MVFNYIENCGDEGRTIYRLDDKCYIGCTVYSKDEAIESIEYYYSGKPALEYATKVMLLMNGETKPCDLDIVIVTRIIIYAFEHSMHELLDWLDKNLMSYTIGLAISESTATLEATLSKLDYLGVPKGRCLAFLRKHAGLKDRVMFFKILDFDLHTLQYLLTYDEVKEHFKYYLPFKYVLDKATLLKRKLLWLE